MKGGREDITAATMEDTILNFILKDVVSLRDSVMAIHTAVLFCLGYDRKNGLIISMHFDMI